MSQQYAIPDPPRVISPSPTPSERAAAATATDGYFGPETRSSKRAARQSSVEPIQEQADNNDEPSTAPEDPELARARTRSRSPQLERKQTAPRMTSLNGAAITSTKAKPHPASSVATSKPLRRRKESPTSPKEKDNLLSPTSAYGTSGFGSAYWRNLSRSPSPLGLIPIHRHWRAFVHKHEIPRKALHVSIGFGTLYLYYIRFETSQIHPVLLSLLLPILSADLIRFRWPAFNRLYIRCLGAFMREAEAHDRYNGVISYLLGLYLTLRFCHKDVAVMSVLLLSWCDTAASTFGRAFGRYTPRIRRGKSLAGSLAAFGVGVGTAALFWGLVAERSEPRGLQGAEGFAFRGVLALPEGVRGVLGFGVEQARVSGGVALGILGAVTGFVVSCAEAVDLWGLDDNLTIPVLAGLGLEGFFRWFGA